MKITQINIMHNFFYRTLIIIVASYILCISNFSYAIALNVKTAGTTSIMLRVHYEEMLERQGLRTKVKNILNKNRFMGEDLFSYLFLENTKNGGVSFSAPIEKQHSAIYNLLKSKIKNIEILQHDNRFIVKFNNTVEKKLINRSVPDIMGILYRRLQGFGIENPLISRVGETHILVEVPTAQEKNIQSFKNLITRSAKLTFLLEDTSMTPQEALVRRNYNGSKLFYKYSGGQKIPYLLNKRPFITNRDIMQVKADNDNYQAYVMAILNKNGTRKLAKVSANNIGKRIAILFEDTVYMAPTIMEVIRSGKIKITNKLSDAQARGLAVLLSAGSYPVSVEVVDERIEANEGDVENYYKPKIKKNIKKEVITKQPIKEIVKPKVKEKTKPKVKTKKKSFIRKGKYKDEYKIKKPISKEEKLDKKPVSKVIKTKKEVKKVLTKPAKKIKKKSFIKKGKYKNGQDYIDGVEDKNPIKNKVKPLDVKSQVNTYKTKQSSGKSSGKKPAKKHIPKFLQKSKKVKIEQKEPVKKKQKVKVKKAEKVVKIPKVKSVKEPKHKIKKVKKEPEEIAPEFMENIIKDPEVEEELSLFEKYLHGTDKLDFQIEDVTSSPRKNVAPEQPPVFIGNDL